MPSRARPIPIRGPRRGRTCRTWPLRRLGAKRLTDLVIGAAALALAAPVIGLAIVAIKLTSRGPAIFKQERVGIHEHTFVLFKLRTMKTNNDDSEHRAYAIRLLTDPEAPAADAEGTFKLTDDPRVTRVGGFLRRYSLDELPQLVNVLRGDMALVGPRPALEWEVAHYTEEQRTRAAVKPGCTGLWQVSGRSKLSTQEMLELDVHYARNWTTREDLRILAKTPSVLLRGDGAR